MNDLMCGVGIRQSWQACIWYNSHHKNTNESTTTFGYSSLISFSSIPPFLLVNKILILTKYSTNYCMTSESKKNRKNDSFPISKNRFW